MDDEIKTTVFKSNQTKRLALPLAGLTLIQGPALYSRWGHNHMLWFIVMYTVLLAFFAHCFFVNNQLVLGPENIEYIVPGQRWQMSWNDIQRIEMDTKSRRTLFCGADDKRMAVGTLNVFPGFEKALSAEAEKRHIPIQHSGRAVYVGSNGTEVPKSSPVKKGVTQLHR